MAESLTDGAPASGRHLFCLGKKTGKTGLYAGSMQDLADMTARAIMPES